jgi:hypothetical protein
MTNSKDCSGNRTRDLPACSAVPQPNATPRTLIFPLLTYIKSRPFNDKRQSTIWMNITLLNFSVTRMTYMYVRKYACTHICVYIYIYVCVCVCLCVHMYICMYLRTYVCMYVYAYTNIYMHMYTRVYVCRICTYVSMEDVRI